MKRSGPIKRVSSKQAKKNRTWSALKLARIKARIEAVGYVSCEECRKRYYNYEYAIAVLQAHHIIQRSLCGEYTDAGLRLLCWDCHEKAHSSEGLRSARLTGRFNSPF